MVEIEQQIIWGLVAWAVLLFFSAAEGAFVGANRLLVEVDRKQHRLYDRILGQLVDQALRTEDTALWGRIFATVWAVVVWLSVEWWGSGVAFVGQVVVVALVVVASRWLATVWVRTAPNDYLRWCGPVLWLFYWIFYPLTWARRSVEKPDDEEAEEEQDELQSLLRQGDQEENDEELKLLSNALEFAQKKVRDCMIPRVDTTAFELGGSVNELRRLFVETQFSRIPVYDGSIDRVVGYVASRRLFERPATVEEVLLPVIYVPEAGDVQDLLAELIKSRSSLAVVLDEFGTTAGMVTLEDLLEEIFGEIDDEHDERPLLERTVADGEYLVVGRTPIRTANEKYGLALPESEEYSTLAGWLIHTAGEIPEVGDEFEHQGARLRVVRASGSRIAMVRVARVTEHQN